MKIIFKTLVIVLAMVLSSCSDANTHISSNDNFEIVELPDGSIAYLNSNSSITYDKDFSRRIVRQYGEVFYEVRKGDSPFIVSTELGEIEVLGTKFNVKSDNKEMVVEVQEGSVELRINKFVKKIKKGQKAFFKESNDVIKVYKTEFKNKGWIYKLNKNFKKFGKEMNKSFKEIGKDSKNFGTEIGNMVKD